MATMAIDVLDLNWRILQGQEKPCTRRGWRMIHCNPHRARGDRCHHREKHSEGSRIAILERTSQDDIEQESSESDDERYERPRYDGSALRAYMESHTYKALKKLSEERKTRKALKKAARSYIRQVRREDLLELDLIDIEREIRRERERIPDIHARRRFLKDFIEFLEEQVDSGVGAPTRALLIEHRIELCELESLLIAA